MVIDLILDRKDARAYNAHYFYMDCMRYGRIADEITRAMDAGVEEDVRRALCEYVIKNNYNPLICEYVQRLNWIGETNPVIEEAAAVAFESACRSQEVETTLEERLSSAGARSAEVGESEFHRNNNVKEY